MTTVDPVDAFVDGIQEAPWGMLSRAQTDYLIFKLLAESNRIDVSASDFDLANDLRTTVSRVRALRYRLEQDQMRERPDGLANMLTTENFAFENARDNKLRVAIRSRFLREFFASELSRRGAIALTELTPSTLLVPIDAFADVLIEIGVSRDWLDTEEGQTAHNALIQQLSQLRSREDARAAVSAWEDTTKSVVGVASGVTSLLKAAFPHIFPS